MAVPLIAILFTIGSALIAGYFVVTGKMEEAIEAGKNLLGVATFGGLMSLGWNEYIKTGFTILFIYCATGLLTQLLADLMCAGITTSCAINIEGFQIELSLLRPVLTLMTGIPLVLLSTELFKKT